MAERWERLADLDPLFVALAHIDHAQGGWDPSEFLESGRAEIGGVFGRLEALAVTLPRRDQALDFGCGPGRLTQALAERFVVAEGVDISPRMIETANAMNRRPTGCHFRLLGRSGLSVFEDRSFDFVYSNKVLFHMRPGMQLQAIAEFLRVTRPGGVVVFGLSVFAPARTAWERFRQRYKTVRRRLINRQNYYYLLRAFGFRPRWLYRKFGLRPMMPMYTIDEARVAAVLEAGVEVLAVDKELRRHRMNARWIIRVR